MARFASKTQKTRNVRARTPETPAEMFQREDATTNYEGGLAFTLTPELDLYMRCCASFLSGGAYRSEEQELAELREVIQKCDRSFVLKLANYSRNSMNLRTIPQVLLAEASRLHSGDPAQPKRDVREYTPKILVRADEPLEVIAYLLNQYGSKQRLANALKKGIADAIRNYVHVDQATGKMDLYALAKYWRGASRKKAAVSPKDLLRICHLGKKADPLMKEVASLVFNDALPVADTWETKASVEGTSTEMWNEMAPKMKIGALLRNLRNFEQHKAEKAIEHAVSVLTNPEVVQKSRQLPFRWWNAMRHVQDTRLRDALAEAMDLSVDNIPKLPGVTAVFSDNSGSMSMYRLSNKSSLSCIDVAAVMTAIGAHLTTGNSVVGAFACEFKRLPLSRRDSIIANADKIRHANVGGSTNAWKSIDYLLKEKLHVDRVLVFSDMQCYNSGVSKSYYYDNQLGPKWREYVQTVNPNAMLYSVDLRGLGTSQFPEDDPNVVLLSGWSEQIFDFIANFEKRGTIIETIKRDW